MPVFIRGIFGGGGKIKDATALPEDVKKGKVFYNNDGRQVGVKEDKLKVISLGVPYNYSPPVSNLGGKYHTSMRYWGDGQIQDCNTGYSTLAVPTTYTYSLSCRKILYIEFEQFPNVIFPVLQDDYGKNFNISIQTGTEMALNFAWCEGIIYLNSRLPSAKGKLLHIYYI